MILTAEEASIARAVAREHPRAPPDALLSQWLLEGHIERVARIAAGYHFRGSFEALEYYLLALIASSESRDWVLAHTVLQEATRASPEGGFRGIIPQIWLDATILLVRMDFGRLRPGGTDLKQRLRILAAVEASRRSQVPLHIRRGIEFLRTHAHAGNFSTGDVLALTATLEIRLGELEPAFTRIARALEGDPENPYAFLAGHRLAQRVPANHVVDLLQWRRKRPVGVVARRYAVMPGIGMIEKECDGSAFARSAAGRLSPPPRVRVIRFTLGAAPQGNLDRKALIAELFGEPQWATDARARRDARRSSEPRRAA